MDDPLVVVGIDPGSTKLGLSVIELDLATGIRTLLFSTTIDAGKAISRDSGFAETCGKRDARLTYLAREIGILLEEYCPHIVAAESAFAQRYRISAYEALIETMAVIRATVWRYSHVIKLYKVDPVTVKNHVGVSHIKTDKLDVENAVKKLYAKTAKCDIHNLDEHAYDAIAIAHAAIDKLVDNKDLVSTRKKSNKISRGGPKPKPGDKPKGRRKRRGRRTKKGKK